MRVTPRTALGNAPEDLPAIVARDHVAPAFMAGSMTYCCAMSTASWMAVTAETSAVSVLLEDLLVVDEDVRAKREVRHDAVDAAPPKSWITLATELPVTGCLSMCANCR